jgi:hypothetical protein
MVHLRKSNTCFKCCSTGQFIDSIILVCRKYICIIFITEYIIDASTEVGLEEKAEKIKCMLKSRHENAGRNHIKGKVISVAGRGGP